MRIGIVSDTHDRHLHVQRAMEVLQAQGAEYLLHAGDMTACATASLLAGVSGIQLIAVFGNCDTERTSLRATIETLGGEVHERTYDGQVDGKAVYMMHVPRGINEAAAHGTYDLVVYGHTHEQDIRKLGPTLVVNPGARDVVVVDLADMTVTAVSLA